MKFSELDKYGEDEMDTPTVVGAEEDDAHLTQVTVITSRPLVGTFHLPTAFTSLTHSSQVGQLCYSSKSDARDCGFCTLV